MKGGRQLSFSGLCGVFIALLSEASKRAAASLGIDAIQEGLIGRVIVEWSRLENTLDDLIWTLAGLTFEDGRVLTSRTDAKTKIAMLKVLAPRHLTDPTLAKVEEALVLADSLRDDRNFIMHGS